MEHFKPVALAFMRIYRVAWWEIVKSVDYEKFLPFCEVVSCEWKNSLKKIDVSALCGTLGMKYTYFSRASPLEFRAARNHQFSFHCFFFPLARRTLPKRDCSYCKKFVVFPVSGELLLILRWNESTPLCFSLSFGLFFWLLLAKQVLAKCSLTDLSVFFLSGFS